MLILLQMFSGSQDETRLTNLVMRYWNEMVRFSESLIGNHQDAEDAVQTAFISIYEQFEYERGMFRFEAGQYIDSFSDPKDYGVYAITEDGLIKLTD